MSNVNPFHNPFMLGFDELSDIFLSISKGAESFPPYNIEQTGTDSLRITLAVAGYKDTDLDVSIEENQLVIRGKQDQNPHKHYIHRGIAGRSFIKSFVLADGLKITEAYLEKGLINIDLLRPQKTKKIHKIEIRTKKCSSHLLSSLEDE